MFLEIAPPPRNAIDLLGLDRHEDDKDVVINNDNKAHDYEEIAENHGAEEPTKSNVEENNKNGAELTTELWKETSKWNAMIKYKTCDNNTLIQWWSFVIYWHIQSLTDEQTRLKIYIELI